MNIMIYSGKHHLKFDRVRLLCPCFVTMPLDVKSLKTNTLYMYNSEITLEVQWAISVKLKNALPERQFLNAFIVSIWLDM